MATAFINKTSNAVGTANTLIGNYTANSGFQTLAISFTFSNITTAVTTISAFLRDNSASSNTFFLKDANIPVGSALTLDSVKVALEPGDGIYCYSGNTNAVDAVMTVLELN